jgi:hypothetical protein
MGIAVFQLHLHIDCKQSLKKIFLINTAEDQSMMRFLLLSLVFFLSLACKARSVHALKVTAGKPSSDPSIVYFFSGGFMCSGTVVGEDLILTAAHCFENDNPQDLMIVQHFDTEGNPLKDRQYYKGKDILVHPLYDADNVNGVLSDLALIRTDRKLDTRMRRLLTDPPKEGDEVIYTGFGRTKANDPASNESLSQFSGTKVLPSKISIESIYKNEGPEHYYNNQDFYTAQLVEWNFFSRGLQTGVLATIGSTSTNETSRFHKGSGITSGDSGTSAFLGDAVLAVASSVAVLEDHNGADGSRLNICPI